VTRDWWRRVPDASAVAGGVGWIGLAVIDAFGPIEGVLALAMLVLVPLGVGLADAPRQDGSRTRWYQVTVAFQPAAALSGVASLAVDQGSPRRSSRSPGSS